MVLGLALSKVSIFIDQWHVVPVLEAMTSMGQARPHTFSDFCGSSPKIIEIGQEPRVCNSFPPSCRGMTKSSTAVAHTARQMLMAGGICEAAICNSD